MPKLKACELLETKLNACIQGLYVEFAGATTTKDQRHIDEVKCYEDGAIIIHLSIPKEN